MSAADKSVLLAEAIAKMNDCVLNTEASSRPDGALMDSWTALLGALSTPGTAARASVGANGDVLAKIEKALTHVHDLCQGREKWTMRVPARPDLDSDLIICDALEAARSALSARKSTDA